MFRSSMFRSSVLRSAGQSRLHRQAARCLVPQLCLLFSLAGFLQLASSALAQAPPTPVDTAAFPAVVAMVDGHPIRKKELLTQAALMRAQIRRSGQEDPAGDPAFYRQVLDGLIGEVLVFQYTQKSGLGASGEEIQTKIQQMSSRFADAAAFDQALVEQGTNRGDLEGQLNQALSVQRFIDQEIGERVQIPEESKQSFYRQNLERMKVPERRRVRHILLRSPRDASSESRDDALTRALGLRQRLSGGTDFAGLAKIHSDDGASKNNGGDLGWIQRTGQRPEFEAAAFALQVDEISDAIESAAGYHLIQVLEVQADKTPSYDEVSSRIEERLKGEIIQRELAQRVEALKATAKIDILI